MAVDLAVHGQQPSGDILSGRHPTHQAEGGGQEFRQHLGGRLTVTMLRGMGDPIDVHEIDRKKMQESINFVADRVASVQ